MRSSITPGLVVLHGNQLELLRDAVLDWIGNNPLDPLEPEYILVQSNGVAEWLKIAIAQHAGISAAQSVMLPARFLWQSYREMLGAHAVPYRSAFDKDALTWRLMRMLPAWLKEDDFAPLKCFLADGDPERRLQLAQRLADLFDQYQVYRADWLEDWRRGNDDLRLADGRTQPLGADQRWQARLWRGVCDSVEDATSGRAHVHRRFLQAIEQQQAPQGRLPRRVVLFGISALPLQTLEALAGLAMHCQVVMAVPNPCQFYWGDIIDGRELLRAERRRQRLRGGHDLSSVPLDELHAHSHPLLAGWGRQGRDFIRLLDQFDDVESARQRFPQARIDLFDESPGDTLLSQVQAAVRDLLPLNEHEYPAPGPDDKSIEFHLVHSAQREVEVLHDQLLHWFASAGETGLRPRDVVVMVPDIEQFAPAVRAVFELYGRNDPRYIPFEIADVRDRSINPMLCALDWLLRLPTQRCRQSEVRDLLDVPAVAARFGLNDAEGLARLAGWIDGAGIRWGLDHPHRNSLGLGSAGEQNSWLFGVRRMLMGYAVGDGAAWGGVEPYLEVGGLNAALAGSLAQLIEALIEWRNTLSGLAVPAEWAQRARQLLLAFFSESDERDRLTRARLESALQYWLESCDEAGFVEPVPLAVLREAWLGPMDEPALNHRFVSGGVTFCTLMPMRAVPFRVVCLLGMNDGDYPRRASRVDFDLLAAPGLARPGDRSRHDDDRYLMLEALLAARDKLYISWVGRNIRDNAEEPPSVLVSQLRDYLKAGWGLDPATLTTAHPLQPFSRRYFERDGLVTYAYEWRSAHSAGSETPHSELPPFVPEPDQRLSVRELADFIRHPVRHFFRRRLAVVFADEQVISEDDEPFGLNGLEEYQLADHLLEEASQHVLDDEAVPGHLQAQVARLGMTGRLPIGLIGRRKQAELVAKMTPVCLAWLRLTRLYPRDADKLPVRFDCDGLVLEDWLDHLYANDVRTAWFSLTASKLWDAPRKGARADKLVQGWLRQLLAGANGAEVCGFLVGRDATVRFDPVDREAAQAALSDLMRAWIEGMSRPLPTAFNTGLAQMAGGDPATVYDGGFRQTGEVEQDRCLARQWPAFEALEAEPGWLHWSQCLYAPLLDWMTQHVQISLHDDTKHQEEAE
jgi:exodeoxyribonuclease V gamma subunit